MNNREIHRGDIFYIQKHDTYGHQISTKSGRPAVIVSSEPINATSGTVMVAYITSHDSGDFRTQFSLTTTCLVKGKVKCEQITTIDKSLIGDYAGHLNSDDLSSLEECVHKALFDSGRDIQEESNRMDCAEEYAKKDAENTLAVYNSILSSTKQELEIYKKLYESLLEKVLVSNK